MDVAVVGDVVAIVPQRRRIKGKQPERRDAQVLQVVQLLRQPAKIADPIPVAIQKRAHMQLIDDRVLVPERVGAGVGCCHWALRRWAADGGVPHRPPPTVYKKYSKSRSVRRRGRILKIRAGVSSGGNSTRLRGPLQRNSAPLSRSFTAKVRRGSRS